MLVLFAEKSPPEKQLFLLRSYATTVFVMLLLIVDFHCTNNTKREIVTFPSYPFFGFIDVTGRKESCRKKQWCSFPFKRLVV